MTKDYLLDVKLTEHATGQDAFSESYKIALRPEFVNNKTPKEHCFVNHLNSFLTQLKKNSYPLVKKPFKKRQIYVVSYGMNLGSEINGDRPSIIYKDSSNTLGEDLTVVPLTSAVQERLSDKFDVFVPKDASNTLFQNSFARVRQLRSVSVKRL
jgi:mRNA-degrading endonuclease toxin of MazEF toxin-antitoxin module